MLDKNTLTNSEYFLATSTIEAGYFMLGKLTEALNNPTLYKTSDIAKKARVVIQDMIEAKNTLCLNTEAEQELLSSIKHF